MAQKPLEEIAWMKRLIEIAFFLRGGAVPRDSKTHNALHRPSRCLQQHQNCWEAARNTLIYWAGSEEVASEPVASAFQGLWRFADSQKKACPTRPENGAQKFYTNLLVLLIHWTLFKILQAFPAPLRTPSLGCASEGVGYRFPVLVQGHRAHAAPIANAKAVAGAVHGCGTPRAPETRRLHRWRGWWLRPSSRSSRTMRGRGDSWIIMGEYKWRIVRKNWGISIWRNLMKLIS